MQADENGPRLLGVIGATASGKSALAVELCRAAPDLVGEVASMDSMLVYRGLDIGTAKPSSSERRGVEHHLIDHVDPATRYDVSRYVSDAGAVEADCQSRGVTPLFCGGTAFYLQALLFGVARGPAVDPELRERLNAAYDRDPSASFARLGEVDPKLAARVHPNDKKRVVRGLEVFEQTGAPLSAAEVSWAPEDQLRRARLVLLESDTESLDGRILARTQAMFAAGWPDEAARMWPAMGATARAALGYREARAVALGELDAEQAASAIALATRRFARRQRTWLRRFVALGIVRSFPAPATHEDLERLAPEVLEWLSSDD